VSDQFFYSAKQVLQHIDCLWQEWYVLKSREPSEVKSRADPGVQPDLPVVVADIRRAWERSGLDSTERQIFTLRHFWQMDLASIGEVFEITPDEVALTLDGSYEQLLLTINGGPR
jgi:hypothetical protein